MMIQYFSKKQALKKLYQFLLGYKSLNNLEIGLDLNYISLTYQEYTLSGQANSGLTNIR